MTLFSIIKTDKKTKISPCDYSKCTPFFALAEHFWKYPIRTAFNVMRNKTA